MYKITRQGDDAYYGIQEFTVDTRADINTLPIAEMGSTAICVEDSSVWMINSAGVWKEI